MSKSIKVSCLPVAGKENPYQYLMMKGLNESPNLEVKSGIDDKFFGIIRTAVFQKPDYIHFDWETSYYYRKNIILTFISIPLFIAQVLVAKYIFKCKLVWTPHNLVPHDAKLLKIHQFCRVFFAKQMSWIRLFDKDAIDRAKKSFKVSEGKFKIMPEGSYVEYYPNEIDQDGARRLLGIPSNKKVLLYMGLIKPYKGILDLMSSFNSLEDKGDMLLLIAGKAMDAHYLNQIQKKLNPSIILHEGFVKDEDLQIYLNACDIVVLPFENIENSGSVILSMGFGKPIIAPAQGVLPARLKNQIQLLYTTPKITFSTLNEINKFSKNDLKRIGYLNKNYVKQFSWSDYSIHFD